MVKKANFEIIVGTYQEFLLGYFFTSKEGKLTQSFASHDHSSSIRCVAVSDQYLASGASDDRIIIYDLKARKEHCMLTHHESTVTSIAFTKNHSHVVSASNDGVLSIVRVGNWQLEKIWDKAHGGAGIHAISIHDSGKLALTLGADNTLRTWNLVKGRAAYIINLNSKCKDAASLENILWAPDNVRFLLYGGKYTEVWSIETGGVLKVFEHENKVISCVWFDDETLLVGYETGELGKIDINSGEKIMYKAHDTRVKCLTRFKKWVISGSSDGELKVWDKHMEEQAKINTGCRITCVCVAEVVTKTEEKIEEIEIEEKIVKNIPKLKSEVVIEIEDNDEDIVPSMQNKDSGKKKKNKVSIVNDESEGIEVESKKSKKKKVKEIPSANEEPVEIEVKKSVKNKKKNISNTPVEIEGKEKDKKKRKVEDNSDKVGIQKFKKLKKTKKAKL